jgi:hypothetical protein
MTIATENCEFDPLNPEHEAIGRVSWVNSMICRIYLDFPLGGFNPRVVIKNSSIIEIMYSCFLTSYYEVVHNPIFDEGKRNVASGNTKVHRL